MLPIFNLKNKQIKSISENQKDLTSGSSIINIDNLDVVEIFGVNNENLNYFYSIFMSMNKNIFIVTDDLNQKRIDQVVATEFPKISRSKVAKIIKGNLLIPCDFIFLS